VLSGVPLHARNLDVAQSVLGSACVNPSASDFRDRPAFDDREFFVSAWCWHPSYTPLRWSSLFQSLLSRVCYHQSVGPAALTFWACATESALVSWPTRTGGLPLAHPMLGMVRTATETTTAATTKERRPQHRAAAASLHRVLAGVQDCVFLCIFEH